MKTRSIEQQKRVAAQRARLHLGQGRDMKKAEALIEAALSLVREPSSQCAVRAGRAALRAALGQGFRVGRGDVLKTLLAEAIFFSKE